MGNFKRAAVALGVAMCLMSSIGLTACGDTTNDGHAHVYNWATEKAATCTEPGTEKGTCTVNGCKSVDTRAIEAFGQHEMIETVITPATCSAKGVLRISCKRGDFQEDQDIPTLEHRFGDWTNRQEATCTTPEMGTHMCLLCKQSFPGEISPALGHNIKDGKIIEDATCTAEGSMTGYCTRCKTEYDEDNPAVIFAKGHKLSATNRVVLKEATCVETGIRKGECTICGQEATEEIPLAPHVWESMFSVDIAPTYEADGVKSIHCKNCTEQKDQTVLPKFEAGVPYEYEFRLVDRNGNTSEMECSVAIQDADGNVTQASFKYGQCFVKLIPGTYTVYLSGLPTGYTSDPFTLEESGLFSEIMVYRAVFSGNAPDGLIYRQGSTMYDFSFTDIDGNTYTLGELTKQYKLVLINLWATWCGYCVAEFPHMNEAYQQFKDDIFIVAISTEPSDTTEVIRSFRDSQLGGVDFAICTKEGGSNISDHFSYSGIPYSAIVSYEGIIITIIPGALPDTATFVKAFSDCLKFVDPDYDASNLAQQGQRVLLGTEYLPSKELEV